MKLADGAAAAGLEPVPNLKPGLSVLELAGCAPNIEVALEVWFAGVADEVEPKIDEVCAGFSAAAPNIDFGASLFSAAPAPNMELVVDAAGLLPNMLVVGATGACVVDAAPKMLGFSVAGAAGALAVPNNEVVLDSALKAGALVEDLGPKVKPAFFSGAAAELVAPNKEFVVGLLGVPVPNIVDGLAGIVVLPAPNNAPALFEVDVGVPSRLVDEDFFSGVENDTLGLDIPKLDDV